MKVRAIDLVKDADRVNQARFQLVLGGLRALCGALRYQDGLNPNVKVALQQAGPLLDENWHRAELEQDPMVLLEGSVKDMDEVEREAAWRQLSDLFDKPATPVPSPASKGVVFEEPTAAEMDAVLWRTFGPMVLMRLQRTCLPHVAANALATRSDSARRTLQELLDELLKQRPAYLEDRSDTSLLKNT